MRLLIDTHTFIWFVLDSVRLSRRALALMEDGDNDVLVSVASMWEMAIKVGLGKLSFDTPYADFIDEALGRNRIQVLPIDLPHLAVVSTLPLHHRDPFDRLIIAQSMVERLPIISVDAAFDAYDVVRVW